MGNLPSTSDPLLQTVARSRVSPPPLFALLRYAKGMETEKYSGVLVNATKIGNHVGVWKFDVLKHPYEYIDHGHLVAEPRDSWFGGKGHRYLAVLENGRLFEIKMQYHHYLLRIGASNQIIPLCYITDAGTVLGENFLHIERPSKVDWRIVLKPGPLFASAVVLPTAPPSLPVAPVVQTSFTKKKKEPALSQFIVNELVEGILARGMECPITLEKMTRETARILPCGHTISLGAVEHFPPDARSCPQCRKPFDAAQIQRWK